MRDPTAAFACGGTLALRFDDRFGKRVGGTPSLPFIGRRERLACTACADLGENPRITQGGASDGDTVTAALLFTANAAASEPPANRL